MRRPNPVGIVAAVAARTGRTAWKHEIPTGLLGTHLVTFDEPGTDRYHCMEHPWAVGEVTATP